MNKNKKLIKIRNNLSKNIPSIGTWQQIPNASISEILGRTGYDWVAIDLEPGSISIHQLPSLFRSIELGNTLPLARLANGKEKDCKQVMDAGAAGIIVPMVESALYLEKIRKRIYWPPVSSLHKKF